MPYVVVKQGMGNFEKDLEDLKKSLELRDGRRSERSPTTVNSERC